MSSEYKLRQLFERYVHAELSAPELHEFMSLVDQDELKPVLNQLMDDYLKSNTYSASLNGQQKDRILTNIFNSDRLLETEKPKVAHAVKLYPARGYWKAMLAAAMVIIMLAISTFFIYHTKQSQRFKPYYGALKPGTNKAYLTLVDGTKVPLDDHSNEIIAAQADLKIRRTADGQLIYERNSSPAGKQHSGTATAYNTISTPAGGQYRVLLPDGTRVWLNAASSLKYPITLAGLKQRKVELQGEAYFEVAKLQHTNMHIPFIVRSKGQEVEVLGTHFNVRSYADEAQVATTLLEGAVVVRRPEAFEKLLKPGEQALTGTGVRVSAVDTSTAVAWKNGLFKFETADIYSVMQQFSRWYDIDVAYEGAAPKNRFTGEIYRDMDANDALKLLKLAHIKFRVEAPGSGKGRKKVIISNK
ncbi:FecR family protein [Pedobacter sp. SAFR-022]|uniref:FecR family protein n=1 Tax=Pedobacter sp. SAFR-022 TaxID=3436861 RepID=UPI003F7D7930